MTAPEAAGIRFLLGCALGAGIGIWHDLLKPLGRRHVHLADLLLFGVVFWAWLVQSFDVCQGDLRLGYTAALGVGWTAWELTLGRMVSPLFDRVWGWVSGLLRFVLTPLKKFFRFLGEIAKKLFASAKKWVTIGWNNRRHRAAGTGGKSYAKDPEIASPGQAGRLPQPSHDQGHAAVRGGVFHAGSADASRRHFGK